MFILYVSIIIRKIKFKNFLKLDEKFIKDNTYEEGEVYKIRTLPAKLLNIAFEKIFLSFLKIISVFSLK